MEYTFLWNQTHDHIKLYGVHLSMESNTFSCVKGWGYDVQQYFSYMVAVSFIGGGNQRTWRKPPTCRKSLTNFITCCIEYTLPLTGFEFTTLVVIGTDCTGSYKSNYHTIMIMMASN